MVHIVLSGEVLFNIGFFPVTNTMLSTWIVMIVLIVVSKTILSSYKKIPTRSQIALESMVMGLYTAFEGILGKNTKRFFPLLATLFLFIITCNWFGLLPSVGTIGIKKLENSHSTNQTENNILSEKGKVIKNDLEESGLESDKVVEKEITEEQEIRERAFDIPLFRAPTADLNTTLALALIGMGMLQFWGIRMLGSLTYLGKFISFKDPISFFVGLLELISEFGKIISFAFRLFGNIFAGEVLLVIIGSLMPVIAPLPFVGLEIFVGFIQALVFSMLLAVFLSIGTQAHH